ncbi:MAG: S24 family peptidase [Pseudomonadota bacterium]|nr:S24 family peptidase [Pseudomonadota bacterium]
MSEQRRVLTNLQGQKHDRNYKPNSDAYLRDVVKVLKGHLFLLLSWCNSPRNKTPTFCHIIKSLLPEVYEKLAAVAKVPVTAINGDEAFLAAPGEVSVIGKVQAGEFQPTFPELSDAQMYSVAVPLPGNVKQLNTHVFGLEIYGESMNRHYQDGSVVVCLPLWAVKRDLKSGDHVIVERVDLDGSIEATVKEFVLDADGEPWLWPRSDSPLHQTPIQLNGDTTSEVRITAYVIASYSLAANFSIDVTL